MADIVLFPCQYEMRIPPQRQERLHPREPPWTVWICCAGRPDSLPELGGNSLELETRQLGYQSSLGSAIPTAAPVGEKLILQFLYLGHQDRLPWKNDIF